MSDDMIDRALLDELLYSNETPSRSSRRLRDGSSSSSDISPSRATGLESDFALEASLPSSPFDVGPTVKLAPDTAQKVLAALRAAFDGKDRFEVEYDIELGNYFAVEDPVAGFRGHHLDLRMDSTDGKEVYISFLRAGPRVRGREMLARLDAFARDFGVRRIHLLDAASIRLTAADGTNYDITYSVLTILATGLSYYNHFGYSDIFNAKANAAHNEALISDQSLESTLNKISSDSDAIAKAVQFVDDNSDVFFGGHRAAKSTTRQIFEHLIYSGAIKRGGGSAPIDASLAAWIADMVDLFSGNVRVPLSVDKTSFADDEAAAAGGRLLHRRTTRTTRTTRKRAAGARRHQSARALRKRIM